MGILGTIISFTLVANSPRAPPSSTGVSTGRQDTMLPPMLPPPAPTTVKVERDASEDTAPLRDNGKAPLMVENTEATRTEARQKPPAFDLNIGVVENLLIELDWYKEALSVRDRTISVLQRALAEANQLLRREPGEIGFFGDDDSSRGTKRMRDEGSSSTGGPAARNRFALFPCRSSAPPPLEQRQRRPYSPARQRSYSPGRQRPYSPERPRKFCDICRMRNHSTEECRVKTGACFFCGEMGHKKYECKYFRHLKKQPPPPRQPQPPVTANAPKNDDGSSSSEKTEP